MSYYDDDYTGGRKSMSIGAWIAIGILVVFLFGIFSVGGSCVSTYNNLVNLEEDVNLAFANVQTQLQSRLEKIPDLVKVTGAAADHLENIYAAIAAGRAGITDDEQTRTYDELKTAVGNAQTPEELETVNQEIGTLTNNVIKVIHEDYPTITANEQFTSLMDSIEGAANRVAVAREDYNIAVSAYNRKVRNFPGNILAGIFGFEKKDEFKASDAANQDSLVDFGE